MVGGNRSIVIRGGSIRGRRIGDETAAATDQLGKRLLVGQRGGRSIIRNSRRTRKRAGDIIQTELAQLLAEVLVVARCAGGHVGGGLGRLEPQRSITRAVAVVAVVVVVAAAAAAVEQ